MATAPSHTITVASTDDKPTAPTPAKPAPVIAKPVVAPPASQTPPVVAKPSLQDRLEKYVAVAKSNNTSASLPWEGVCQAPRCGWHTMQLSEQAALTLLRQHVQQHWKLVSNQL